MISAKVFAAVLWMTMSAAGFQYQQGSPCDFGGLDLDGPIDRILQQLPESELRWSPTSNSKFLGVEFSGLNVTGLNKLRRYGALVPFCDNGTRMVQVEFMQEGDIAMMIPWKACTGKEGYIELRAQFSRFTTLFRIEATELDQVIRLVHDGPTVPLTTEQLVVVVYNGGNVLNIVIEYLSYVFSSLLREIWNKEILNAFVKSVDKVLA